MRWRNDNQDGGHWGAVSIALHWLSALTVVGLFALGLWMTGLGYYDPWYHKGPELHRSIGVLLLLATLLRLVWRWANPVPPPLPEHQRWERWLAAAAHGLLYLLLLLVMVSGYLISTADGRAVQVFGWFAVPATVSGIDGQEDIAGAVHLWAASLLIGLAALHAGAALKHHFFDRDRTLLRMLGR